MLSFADTPHRVGWQFPACFGPSDRVRSRPALICRRLCLRRTLPVLDREQPFLRPGAAGEPDHRCAPAALCSRRRTCLVWPLRSNLVVSDRALQ